MRANATKTILKIKKTLKKNPCTLPKTYLIAIAPFKKAYEKHYYL